MATNKTESVVPSKHSIAVWLFLKVCLSALSYGRQAALRWEKLNKML